MEEFYEHFSNINSDPNQEKFNSIIDQQANNLDINSPITESESCACIHNLKNCRASSPSDNILNEYLKTTIELMLPLYTKLLNNVLDKGIMPTSWLNGVIVTIKKNKGDSKNLSNYRPITILRCFGKLFTSELNHRLTKYLDKY